MPDASLPPLPPAGRPGWLLPLDDLRTRIAAFRVIGRGITAFRERSWPPRCRTVVAGAAALLVAVAAILAWTALTPRTAGRGPIGAVPTPVAAEPAAGEPAASRDASTGVHGSAGPVVVDVVGAVTRPGLVHLPDGSRVADALAAAGGPTADADLAVLNQARVVADGELIRVPRVGEAPVVPGTGDGTGTAPGPVDLNRATAAELDVLPGVGPATAAAIVAWRTGHGRFRTIEDLLEVPGIGPGRLERLRPLVKV